MEIKTHNQTIHDTRSCKYLGICLDNHLNLHQHFDNVCKKASARVRLLSRIREKVSPYVAESIYKSMMRPLLLYYYPLQLSLPQGTVNKLQYIQNRAAKIVNPKAKRTSWDSIEKIRNIRVAIDVFKSLHNLLPEDLLATSKDVSNEINTRGNGSCVVLPKCARNLGKNRLPTREPTDSKKQLVTKYPSCFLKRN